MITKQSEIPEQPARISGDALALVAPPQEDSQEVSLVQLANVLLRHRWLIIGFPLLLAAIFSVYSLARPRTYTASASFTPQASEMSRGGLASVAAQFGVAVPTGQLSQSPAFYATLLTSREILEQTAAANYSFVAGGKRYNTSGIDLLDVPPGPPEARRQAAADKLRNSIVVGTARETGIVHVTVTTPWAPFSQQVDARLLELVNNFNMKRRQSQAGAERQFVETRLGAARRELVLAEDRLKYFLQTNRAYEGSPQLLFEKDRLQRDVDLKQQVFSSLSQSYEQARIEEVRNIPVITVVEQPAIPIRPDKRGTVTRATTGLFAGAVIAMLLAFLIEFARNKGVEGGNDVEQFAALRRQLLEELKHPLRSLRRSRAH